MTALMRCHMCGASEGYESSGYIMTCCSCLRGMVVVSRTHDEDVAEWNSAGAHAQSLRDRVAFLEDSIKRVVRRYRSGHPAEMSEYIGEFLIATLETGPEDIVWPEEQKP